MRLSIIIPTYREAKTISVLVEYLLGLDTNGECEVIVSDGGSDDDTIAIAANAGAIAVSAPEKGRAAQMNYGASLAKGDILYFVHADTFPPETFISDIQKTVEEGYSAGRYQTRFNSRKFVLRLNAFFTRFDWFMCYGGDQTLFIEKKVFDAIGGFNAHMYIMEDYEIVERVKKIAKYKVLPAKALVSARKYETNSWLAVQKANYIIVQMYKKGASQQEMVRKYKELLDYR
jgi:rSAM/selenodomain-associated transferase 2